MNTQKTITILLGLAVVVGLIAFAVASKNRAMLPEIVGMPSVPIEQPVDSPNSTPGSNPNTSANFGQAVTLRLNQEVTYPDTLKVKLMEINDSRCQDGVVCIWAGEISGAFMLEGGRFTAPKEIRLGAMTSQSVTEENYTFTLESATTASMTIVVSNNKATTQGRCYVGGCSSQICSDQEGMASTCEYREEYACYQTATCERQASGQCGWTETPALKACLQNK